MFSESFEAGLAQQAAAPCSFGVVDVLPLCLDALRGLNISLLMVQNSKRPRELYTPFHGSASFAFFSPSSSYTNEPCSNIFGCVTIFFSMLLVEITIPHLTILSFSSDRAAAFLQCKSWVQLSLGSR